MPVDDPHREFDVVVTVSSGQALVSVRGEIDHVHSAELGRTFNALIDQGHRDLVVDLGGVEFLDSPGLKVLEDAVHRLARTDGSLTLRSPSAVVRRLLGIVGLDDVIQLEGSSGTVEGPGDGHRHHMDPADLDTGTLAMNLRRLVTGSADDKVVDTSLRMIVALAQVSVVGADGVSVSLQRHGRLSTVAATDLTIADMDANQYATGEGPCVAASVEGRWFHVQSLAEEDRWPEFIPRAMDLGINSILSSPLMTQDRPVGALNIYSRTDDAFAPEDQQLASVFATQASIVVSSVQVNAPDDGVSVRLDRALRARMVIAQAQGVIMERKGLDQDAAYDELLHFSRGSDVPLRARAEAVVASTQNRITTSPPDLAGDA